MFLWGGGVKKDRVCGLWTTVQSVLFSCPLFTKRMGELDTIKLTIIIKKELKFFQYNVFYWCQKQTMVVEIVIAGCILMLIWWLFKSGLVWLLLLFLIALLVSGYFYLSGV